MPDHTDVHSGDPGRRAPPFLGQCVWVKMPHQVKGARQLCSDPVVECYDGEKCCFTDSCLFATWTASLARYVSLSLCHVAHSVSKH